MRNSKLHFFHHHGKTAIFLLFSGLLILLSSCTPEKPEDFDRRDTEQLQAVCQALRAGDSNKAYEALQSRPSPLRESALGSLLRDFHRKTKAILDASQLLREQDYDSIEAIVSQAENDGLSSPELLHIRNVERALQALESYCVRMPWEDSRSLGEALDRLTPHLETLEKSEEFRKFHAAQLAEMDRLRRLEKQRVTEQVYASLEKCLSLSDYTEGRRQLEILRREVPEHQLFTWLTPAGNWQAETIPEWPEDQDSRHALELAIVFAAPQSPSELWRGFKGRLTENEYPQTLPGKMMKALYTEDPEDLLRALEAWPVLFSHLSPPSPLLEGLFRTLGYDRLGRLPDKSCPVIPDPLTLQEHIFLWHTLQTAAVQPANGN